MFYLAVRVPRRTMSHELLSVHYNAVERDVQISQNCLPFGFCACHPAITRVPPARQDMLANSARNTRVCFIRDGASRLPVTRRRVTCRWVSVCARNQVAFWRPSTTSSVVNRSSFRLCMSISLDMPTLCGSVCLYRQCSHRWRSGSVTDHQLVSGL